MNGLEAAIGRRNALLLVLAAGTAFISPAQAEVGRGYLQIPGVSGSTVAKGYEGWVRIEGRYWGMDTPARINGTGPATAQAVFSAPEAPTQGSGELVVAIDKKSPALAALMAKCASNANLPELSFAESADDFRSAALELGERPATIPAFFQYRLKDVRFAACPVANAAPEQGFVLRFGGIEWLNYASGNPRLQDKYPGARKAARKVEPVVLAPTTLRPEPNSARVKTFVVSWLGYAHNVDDRQCPEMTRKPTPEQFGLKDAVVDDAAGTNSLERRGPGELNVCMLPGIAPDPGNPGPQTVTAHGLNLDGHDGSGKFPASTCPHKNYVGLAGERGIDNQFYSVAGCMPGLQGTKGLWPQVLNEEWRSGAVSVLVQISGIDDEKNDDDVSVTIFYSDDDPEKDASGKEILADYTFRAADTPVLAHYATKLQARIVNGVIETLPAKNLILNMVKGPAMRMEDARFRLRVAPDGSLAGTLAGYQSWRYLANYYNSIGFEITFGFQCPGFYNALKRAADGMKDPETDEFNGISTAYDIQGVPAFIVETPQNVANTASTSPAG